MTVLVLAAMVAAIWAWLLFGHGRFWQAGPTLPIAAPHARPPVAIIVPARNEADSIAACVTSLLAQDYAGPLQIYVTDDGSTDGTGAILRGISDPRLHIIDGAPRPEGWAGKLWALAQALQAAKGARWFLFSDADIVHDPRHLSALLAQAERSGAVLVSEMVRLSCASLAEQALVPAFVFFFQLLYPFAWVNDPKRATAAAGGTMLIQARTLAVIGGMEAIRGSLIDDVTLAMHCKPFGRIWLGHSRFADSIRAYPTSADIWRMIARSAYVQLRFSPLLLLAMVIGMALVWLAPLSLALFGHGLVRWLGFAAWAGATLSYLPTLRRCRLSPLWALALPGIAVFYMAATIGSALDHHRGRGVVWKNRAYQGAAE